MKFILLISFLVISSVARSSYTVDRKDEVLKSSHSHSPIAPPLVSKVNSTRILSSIDEHGNSTISESSAIERKMKVTNRPEPPSRPRPYPNPNNLPPRFPDRTRNNGNIDVNNNQVGTDNRNIGNNNGNNGNFGNNNGTNGSGGSSIGRR